MSDLPKISIITPCLNGAEYLEEAIQSVLDQGYPDFEHIVVDGGSTDGTLDILKKHPHIKWVSGPDGGQSQAMNKGFAMSTGDVIVYLNADDFFAPDAFHTAARYLDRDKGVYFVVGECRVIDEDGNELPGYGNPVVTLPEMVQWWKYIFPQNPSSYFYLREVHDAVGLFNEEMHFTMDYDFLLRCACRYELLKVPETLGNFRYIPGTKTFDACEKPEYADRLRFANKYWKCLPPLRRLRVWLSYSRRFGLLAPVFSLLRRARSAAIVPKAIEKG